MGCRYDEIKLECVSQLVSALRSDAPENETWTKFCEIIDGRFKGDLEYVKDTLSLLWGAANRSNDALTITKPNGPPLVRPFLGVEESFDLSDSLHPPTVIRVRMPFTLPW